MEFYDREITVSSLEISFTIRVIVIPTVRISVPSLVIILRFTPAILNIL